MEHTTEDKQTTVLHIASGDLWAGAEVQLFTLLTQLMRAKKLRIHAILLNEGTLAERLREHSVSVTVLDESKLSGLQIIGGICRLLRQLRPDIVHTHRLKENVCGTIANLLTARVPSVRTAHGAPEHFPKGLANLHKKLFAHLDVLCGRHLQHAFISVSRELAATLTPIFGEERVHVIENGIDIESIRAQSATAEFRLREPACTHIGIVGRLEPVKRVDLFLQACAILAQQIPTMQWRFHVFGDGSLRSQMERLSQRSKVDPFTTFHGHRADILACIASLDVLVMSSDHEGLPMTPLEAIALGTPVVAHEVGGLREILEGGSGGVLNSDHTPRGYAHAVASVLGAERIQMMRRGQERLQTRFSASLNAEKTLHVYRKLLAQK